MKLFLSLLFLFTFVLPQPLHAQDNLPNWHMAGANAQRTSWVAAEVNPQQADSFGVLWYRPIEAYIGQHVQLTTGYGNIYVATARGLYALNANTGEVTWRYDTELPLGHSPTVVDGMAFVGGLDRRVYALDAQTGQLRWQFEGAQAGFTTSPLVVEGMVLLGGRDG
ncbi:MAG: PQQ-binding-like beta-propeller repeat protein, partial [Caldilineaceae bacterium]|nr:PQQ-binding-like beta-propeller repeat protein [Caldilineaceae bacterium]